MRVTQLGEANHLSWLADIEQVCKLKDCWDVVVAPMPAAAAELLDGLDGVPSKAALSGTMADPDATQENKRHATAVLGALEWRRKDQTAQAVLKLNLEAGKHDALKECDTAHEVYQKVQDSFTSRGLSGKIELRRRLCSLRKKPQESMTGFINRAAMLKIEMGRMGIPTPEEELVAALLAGLPATYSGTVELLENHGPEDLAGVTRRLLAAELKHRRLEGDEDEAVVLAAAPMTSTRATAPHAATGAAHPAAPPTVPGHRPPPVFAPLVNPYQAHLQGGYFQGDMAPYGPMMPPPRAARTCWGCGQPGHLQRQCHTHPPVRPPYSVPTGRMPGFGRPVGPAPMAHAGGAFGYGHAMAPAAHHGRGHAGAGDGRGMPARHAPGGGPANASGGAPSGTGYAMMALATDHATRLDGDDWIMDSGASHHMTSSPFSLESVHDIDPVEICLAGGQTICATQAGEVTTMLHGPGGRFPVHLQGVLVVPGLAVNLFSIKVMTRRGFGAYFYDGGVDILGTVGIVFKGLPRGNVYVLPSVGGPPSSTPAQHLAAAAVAAPVWHSRLAHAGTDAVLRTAPLVDAMEVAGAHPRRDLSDMCDACAVSKICRKPFPKSTSAATVPLELVHTDVCGPMPVTSVGGARYIVTVLDDYSDAHEAVPIATKADAGEAVRTEVARWEARTGRRLQRWRSDRCGEYMSATMAAWTRKHGATHETTAPYTPQQNGKAERLNRTLLEKVGASMTAAACATDLWGEAVSTVSHVVNRTVRAGASATPIELLFGQRPSVAHLRVFGCRAFVLTPATQRRKLSPRGTAGTFVGYAKDCKAYRVLVNGTIKVSRDVVFDESRMGSADVSPGSAIFSGMQEFGADWDTTETDVPPAHRPAPADSLGPPGASTDAPGGASPTTSGGLLGDVPSTAPDSSASAAADAARADPKDRHGGTLLDAAELAARLPRPAHDDPRSPARRSLRARFMPARLGEHPGQGDAGGGSAALAHEAQVAITPAWDGASADAVETGVYHPISLERGVGGSAKWDATAYTAYERSNPDKMTLAQARREDDWPAFNDAVLKEMNALWDNGTFELTHLPAGAAVLPFQILCERKRGSDGQVARHKGRGVACGNFQVPGRDFGDVWAPVVRRATLLCLLSHAAAEGLQMHQLDVETAFLNGPVVEELYVREPKGYERGHPGQVLRLRKAVYGLRQAARQWFLELVKLMDQMGMRQCTADPCLFMADVDGERIYVLVYVDDILLIARTRAHLDTTKGQIMAAFKSRDIGEPTYFLGLHIDRAEGHTGLLVSQRQYVARLAERHGLADAKTLQVPMAPGTVLQKAGEALPQDGVARYQALIGGLLYIATCTRPDVSYAVGKLSRYCAAPTTQREAAALRVLRYLQGSSELGLRFGTRGTLAGYCDADYAGDVDTRRSTSGYVFLLNGAAVSWASKLQPTVAVSTTEAEYIAAATAAREAVWLRLLLGETTGERGPVPMRSDNQSAIHLMHNPGGTARSKHIDVAHHFVRDRVARGELTVRYVATTDMTADALTKALPAQPLQRCRSALGMATRVGDPAVAVCTVGSVGGGLVEPGKPPAVGRAPGDGGGAAGVATGASGHGGSRVPNGIDPRGPTDRDTGGSVGGTEPPCTHLIGWGQGGGHGGGADARQA